MKKRAAIRPRPCETEGCRRPAAQGERLCESCGIERSLFRRDERPAAAIQSAPR